MTGVNFTAYQQFKKWAMDYQPQYLDGGQLPSWQTMILGLVSGAMGPFSNAPIDTIKTYVPHPIHRTHPQSPVPKRVALTLSVAVSRKHRE